MLCKYDTAVYLILQTRCVLPHEVDTTVFYNDMRNQTFVGMLYVVCIFVIMMKAQF